MTAVPPGLLAALQDRYRLDRELGQGGMATVYRPRGRPPVRESPTVAGRLPLHWYARPVLRDHDWRERALCPGPDPRAWHIGARGAALGGADEACRSQGEPV